MLLGTSDPLTVQAFAAHMGLEKTWASRLLARMEKRGLIQRRANPADGRSIIVELTRSGSAEHRKLARGVGSQAADLLSCVPSAERANLERALGVLRDALRSCLATCGRPPRPGRRSR